MTENTLVVRNLMKLEEEVEILEKNQQQIQFKVNILIIQRFNQLEVLS